MSNDSVSTKVRPTETLQQTVRTPGSPGPPPPDGRCEIRWATMNGDAVVVKAGTGSARARIRREAEVLQRLPESVSVRFVEVTEAADHTELVTIRHGSATFADLALLDARERSAALASLCAMVDELHSAGWTHRSIDASHLLIDATGEVRLVSWADAVQPGAGETASMVAEDNADLATVVLEALDVPPGFARGWARMRHARAASRARKKLGQARGLRNGEATADVLRRSGVIPDAGGDRSNRPTWPTRWIALGAVASLAAGAAAAQLLSGEPSGRAPSCTIDAPGEAIGCASATVHGNRVTAGDTTFEIGAPGDIVRVGDWDCDGLGTVVLLERGSGRLFHFRQWTKAGNPIPGELVGTYEGANGLDEGRPCTLPNVEFADGSIVAAAEGASAAGGRTVDPTQEDPGP